MQSVTTIYSAANVIEAHAVRSMLEREGIDARVVGDAIEAGAFSAGHKGTAVLVNTSDALRARELIADAQRSTSPKPPSGWSFQFSVRCLLITTTLVALVAAVMGKIPFAAWGTVALSVLFLGEIAEIVVSSYRAIGRELNSDKQTD